MTIIAALDKQQLSSLLAVRVTELIGNYINRKGLVGDLQTRDLHLMPNSSHQQRESIEKQNQKN